MATDFESALENVSEEPIIIIISSGRVSKWNGNLSSYLNTSNFLQIIDPSHSY